MARKIKTFYASRGCLTAESKESMKDAKAKLEVMIDRALEYRPVRLECRFGQVFAIGATAQGYDYAMFEPEHGAVRGTTCSTGEWDRDAIIDSCRLHAAQNTWLFDGDDAAHIAVSGLSDSKKGELAHWIAFQRKYRELKALGKSDDQCHAEACGYAIA